MTVRDIIPVANVLAGRSGLNRRIVTPQVSAPELEEGIPVRGKAGGVLHLRPQEVSVLCELSSVERIRRIREIVRLKPACIVLTGRKVCRELVERAGTAGLPVLKTGNLSGITRLLVERLARQVSLHGVLVEIFDVGTLIIGESAVGKSEAALDLVLRGHRLCADDLVILEKRDGRIVGRPTELGADLLQIRGLGIINVRSLYGETATSESSDVGLVVELEEWQKGHQYSLVGLRETRYRLLGLNVPYLKLPVKPGRNMATLIEVAARNQMLKNRGVFIARDLQQRLQKRLSA
ncbi:MAG TPA: HPr(Ser) kinase/phosphatase [Nitrospirota bacterium]|nr:HPr(Ser) kinase/phosphatase [Nitrospirota bacterium]